eukprot:GHVO01067769.1.p1 GENE.GHVO01067769.1~~GHVO01067769.1.p1  ORF type:complete len:114 (-),score=11.23 GHVO01067769.1:274-615(-)
MRCVYFNADSLPNKMNEFRKRIQGMIEEPNIIAATEVEPKNSRFELQPVDFMLEGYTAFTNINHNGRGIIIWVHNSLNAAQFNMQSNFQESLWVEIYGWLYGSRLTEVRNLKK